MPVESRNEANPFVLQQDLRRVQQAADEAGVSTDTVTANPGAFGLGQADVARHQNARRFKDGLNSTPSTTAREAKNEVFLTGR